MRVTVFVFTIIFIIHHQNGIRCQNVQFEITAKKPGFPVIIVPGDGGTHMEARLNKPAVVHYMCTKKTDDFFNIWLNLELMVPFILDCWVDNVRLVYDNITRKTLNSPGVDTRIPEFGNTSSVEWLDPSKSNYGAYFKDIVESLVLDGYERGISVLGAPYDFRKAPNECQQYFVDFKQLVENAYSTNDNSPVIIVAHSMGGPFMLYFLSRQTQAWKDQHIKALVTLAGVWGGAVKALKVFASGDNLGIYVLNAWTLRAEQITSPSLSFLLPSKNFWSIDEILVSTPSRNYTVMDFEAYFNDMGLRNGYEMWLDVRDLVDGLTPPGVEVHCLYGIGVDTVEHIYYPSLPNKSPVSTFGAGDGTVNLRSLEGCLKWADKQPHKVFSRAFQNVDHMGIIRSPDVIAYIQSLVGPH